MVAWEMPKRLTSAAIENVNSTLIPTEAELEEAYWKELKPIVEEDESVSHHSEGDEKDGLEKEVGFDDVIDVHAAERKVDLPEEDSKLEEEEKVREKNVGGKELETEPRFDDVRDVPAAETNVEAREEDPKLEEEEEHPNVEKWIADFVTPEKHDVDTNESTQ
ncbi:Hypothetical predicted protein, partial [Olea europaea subsp. europaea]